MAVTVEKHILKCQIIRKELRKQPFSPAIDISFYFCYFFCILSRKTTILSRKLIYKHENSEPFPCLYHIPRLSTAFSAKLIPFSTKTNNILPPFTFPLYTITETPDFCVIVYFCLIVRFSPQSPPFQQRYKTSHPGTSCIFPKTLPKMKSYHFWGIGDCFLGKIKKPNIQHLQGFQACYHFPKNIINKYHHVVGHGNFFYKGHKKALSFIHFNK